MRTSAWMMVVALMVLAVSGGACREGGGPGHEAEEDTLRIDVDEAGRDVHGAVEGAAEKTGRAVGGAMEETGQAIEGAAEETGAAVGRAMEKTGETIERAGEHMQEKADSL